MFLLLLPACYCLQISLHNQDPSAEYKMELNHFADWSDEEWSTAMLPNKQLRAEMLNKVGGWVGGCALVDYSGGMAHDDELMTYGA